MQYHIEQYFAVQDTNHNNKQGCLKRVQSADLIWSITTIQKKNSQRIILLENTLPPSSLLLSSPLHFLIILIVRSHLSLIVFYYSFILTSPLFLSIHLLHIITVLLFIYRKFGGACPASGDAQTSPTAAPILGRNRRRTIMLMEK